MRSEQAPPRRSLVDDELPLQADRQAIKVLRMQGLLSALLCVAALGLALLSIIHGVMGYPVARNLSLAVGALVLYRVHRLIAAAHVQAAATWLVWGLVGVVALHALVVGGLHSAGLFGLGPLLLAGGWLLGPRHALALLLVMVSLLCAFALPIGTPWLWEPLPVSPPGLRALVAVLFLILAYVFVRLVLRHRERDQRSIAALSQQLARQRREAQEREADLRADLEAAWAVEREGLRATLKALRAELARRPLSADLPAESAAPPEPESAGIDLRQLVRNEVFRLRGIGPGLEMDLEDGVLLHTDEPALRAVMAELLRAAYASGAERLHLRAGLLGLDVVDLELVAHGLRLQAMPMADAEARTLRDLQGTLSRVDSADNALHWRLLIPRVLAATGS